MSTDEYATREDVAALLAVFEREQMQRLGALQAVQPLLVRTVKGGAGMLSAAATKDKLDVTDLHAMAQWVIDGKDPWAPRELEPKVAGPSWTLGDPVPAFPETSDDGYPAADVTGVPFETVVEVTATVSEKDDGIHVRFTPDGGGDSDRTTDLTGELVSGGDMSGNVYAPHVHVDEEGLFVFKDSIGKCERVETGPADADGPE